MEKYLVVIAYADKNVSAQEMTRDQVQAAIGGSINVDLLLKDLSAPVTISSGSQSVIVYKGAPAVFKPLTYEVQ